MLSSSKQVKKANDFQSDDHTHWQLEQNPKITKSFSFKRNEVSDETECISETPETGTFMESPWQGQAWWQPQERDVGVGGRG